MSITFAERPPLPREIEQLRLILQCLSGWNQDGTGMLAAKGGKTLPGWRDFERAVALAFQGEGPENKAVFDVLLPSQNETNANCVISCKMRKELNRIGRDGRVTLELSNSAGHFWDQLGQADISIANYKQRPQEVGKILVDVVTHWHTSASVGERAAVDLSKSCYLVLSWNSTGLYQLHQFALTLPNPEQLNWYFPTKTVNGQEKIARHINGDDAEGRVFEWYGESGGQLKFYPKASSALWQSETFELEPLPDVEHGVLAKVQAYFPEQWAKAALLL